MSVTLPATTTQYSPPDPATGRLISGVVGRHSGFGLRVEPSASIDEVVAEQREIDKDLVANWGYDSLPPDRFVPKDVPGADRAVRYAHASSSGDGVGEHLLVELDGQLPWASTYVHVEDASLVNLDELTVFLDGLAVNAGELRAEGWIS